MAGQGINLICEGEKLLYEPLPGVRIVYRRAPDRLKAQWIEKFKLSDVTGQPDIDAIGRAALQYGVISWEGIADPDEQAETAAVNPDNVLRLPKWIVDELAERINGLKRGFVDVPLVGSPTGQTSS